jgi:hypothetical protein
VGGCVGGCVGAWVGGWVGWWSGASIQKAIVPLFPCASPPFLPWHPLQPALQAPAAAELPRPPLPPHTHPPTRLPPQKLLDAKLKRVYAEGAAAKAAGRNPLADAEDDEVDATVDLEAEQALADAAMAALLEEVEG